MTVIPGKLYHYWWDRPVSMNKDMGFILRRDEAIALCIEDEDRTPKLMEIASSIPFPEEQLPMTINQLVTTYEVKEVSVLDLPLFFYLPHKNELFDQCLTGTYET